jgi:hypothetical protein
MTKRPHPVVIGTGPSLNECADAIREAQAVGDVMLFGPNYTYLDFSLDIHLACDPALHKYHGKFVLPYTSMWHWDKDICEQHGYRYIEGCWHDGLWVEDTEKISYGHSSGWQLLNLAHHYVTWGICAAPIYLVGYDMTYRQGEPRHYFSGLSDAEGEYAAPLRKWSLFDKASQGKPGEGLLFDYMHIANQVRAGECYPIINCTPRSAMDDRWFPLARFQDVLL